MSAQPTINGVKFTHCSLTVNVNGREYFGVNDLNYDSERETNGVFGTGPNQIGVALGPLKHSGSMEMVADYANRLRAAIGQGYMGVEITITATFRETAISTLHTVVLSAFIKKDSTKSSQGADPVKTTFDLHVNQVTRDGFVAVPEE
jgi:hypothetical protein